MRYMLKAGMVAVALIFAASAAHAQEKISIYHWFEYIPQELLDKFAAETGIEVTMDTFDSNEAMLATLKAGKLGSYDVAVPGDYMVEIMTGEGMLDTIAEGELANFANIEPQWVDVPFDPGRMHSIPYQWGSTSFSVNRDVYAGDINDTSIIFDPPEEVKGKINVLDSQGEVMLLGIPPPRHSAMLDGPRAAQGARRAAAVRQAALGLLRLRHRQGRARLGRCRGGDDLERVLRQGARGGCQHRVRLSASGLRRLDGQCRAPQGRTQPGERAQVHGLPAGAGEYRRGDQLRALCGRR